MSRFIRSTSVCAEAAVADTSDTLATRRDAAMRAMMRVGSIDSSLAQTALITDRSGGLKGGAARRLICNIEWNAPGTTRSRE